MRTLRRSRAWLALFLALGLVAAACGDDGETTTEDTGDDGTETTAEGGDGDAMPGEGVSVEMARANWSTGYMQAEIYRQLLGELGYDVSDPSETELAPDTFYPALAQGEVDFWANGWFPIHEPQLEGDLPDGSIVSDKVTPVGFSVQQGALQGWLIDKATADEYDITTVDQIADDAEIRELFDTDGDGAADLAGCNDGWGCAIVNNDTIEQNEWGDVITHVQGEYSVLFTDVLARFEQGDPVFFYTWTPNYTVAQLTPGEDVIWLSMDNPLPEQEGEADLPPEECPADPCQLGFQAADIRVVANNDFLSENPAAEALFEAVEIPPADIYAQNLEMNDGADTASDIEAAAADWISENQDSVDEWLETARAAA